MLRRLELSLLLTALCCILALPAAAQTLPRPNIVLMMADDQGWGETGYNGHPYLKTPVLDEMARTGLRLDRFYAASPVCSPTRASVMTGRHANRSGAFAANWSTRPEEITIAQILKQAGYRTAHFGKWHLGPVKAESPLSPGRMGFDEYLSHDNFFETNPPLSRNGAPPEIVPGESSEIVVHAAAAFTRRAVAEGKPFLVVIHFGSPHDPYSGKPEDVAPYAHLGKEIGGRFAEIAAMDRAIGTYRAALDDLKARGNTLVWFNSDNGISLKSLVADGTMRGRPSPIGFWKYATQGENKNGRWVAEDLSRGTTPTTRNPGILFQNYTHPVAKTINFGGEAAWTDNRFKLVVRTSSEGDRAGVVSELYDLLADPREATDIAAKHPDIVHRMTDGLRAWQRSVERSLTGSDYR